ncbi:MAG: PQQ-dependent sugar dehydrogenase [Verrucomicrobiota bacterium]|nr:PQQ-dependent sugar dehydrogenase [Verrucomicrobiota bacterium]
MKRRDEPAIDGEGALVTVTTMFFRIVLLLMAAVPMWGQVEEGELAAGKALYAANCLICHQLNGQGTPGAFPPLAKSDFLVKDLERSIKAVCEGLSGEIVVNGRRYNNSMPPALLNDDQVASVMTYVLNSWGNGGGRVTREQVEEARRETQYPTFRALEEANRYEPLPKAAEGMKIRELARPSVHFTRLAGKKGGGDLYGLALNGDVFAIDRTNGSSRQVLWGRNYINKKLGEPFCAGLCFDSKNRMYVTVNQRNESGTLVTNEVTIFRSTTEEEGEAKEPRSWYRVAYPHGIGGFNHGVHQIAEGPDGMIYVTSGSRTDGNEEGNDPRYWKGGEHELTACIWRFDPAAEVPRLEIYARGLRNAFGFCWNDAGEMFATENGPDANAPEELNRIEKGKHYGFPYQFADWNQKAYPYTPDAPKGLEFTRPIRNLGPDGGRGKPISTFDPHSSPAGIVWLGKSFRGEYGESFLVVRFGQLVETAGDVGFDLLRIRMKEGGDAEVKVLLRPLARPLDLNVADGKIFLLEYTRSVTGKGSMGFPGRILEISF